MELVVVAIVVGLVAATVVQVIGAAARRRSRPVEPQAVTDTSVTPPAEPSEPVPGSAPDRAQRGHAEDEIGSRVVRDRD